MNKYDLCILSAHGAYYTYSYGTFRKHTRTEPIILLTEASTLYKDIIYGFDLLAHRIIKLNGLYCVDEYKRQASGGPIGLVEEGDTIHIDIPNASITLEVSDEVLAQRKAKYVAPEPNIKTGWLSRYARMVTSANLGAVLK